MMQIPKRIFYVWGANELLKPRVKELIQTWKDKMPDFDIVQIDEESTQYFNFKEELKANPWFREVYNRKMWAFVADYVRIKTLYDNGGIYLDTDVEVLHSLEPLLHNEAFVGMQNSYFTEPAILGAQKGNTFLKEVLEFYQEDIWTKGQYIIPDIFRKFLKKRSLGDYPDNKDEQKILSSKDISVYPEKYFIPYRYNTTYEQSCVTPVTCTIHWWNGSWLKPEVQNFIENRAQCYKEIKNEHN